MSPLLFARAEISAAVARGVRQCVVIGSRLPLNEILQYTADLTVQVLNVGEELPDESASPSVTAQFSPDELATALARLEFDRLKTSLFLWLGDAKYRTIDAVMSSLAFIASLPKGSGVVLDYVVERTSLNLTGAALDALASRVCLADGSVQYLIQPQAVSAMLRGFGFERIVDWDEEGPQAGSGRLISAAL